MADKKAMITGASSGIGMAFAKALAKDGFQVTGVARSEGKLKELIASLPGSGHRYVVADLSNPKDTERLCADLAATPQDLLVNNAGVGVYGLFEELALDKQQEMMRLNIDSLVTLSYAYLKTSKQGDALVNVASTLGLLAFPTAAVYAATKAFVISFTESLWHEQKDRNVYVMALCPGVTKTNFHTAAGGKEEGRPPENLAQTPEEVVEEALHGLRRRSASTVVSGVKNGMMLFASRFMTRKAMVNMMGGFGDKSAKHTH